MKKFTSNKIFLRICGFVLFCLLWFVVSEIIQQKTFILPGPIETFKYMFELLQKPYIYNCIGTSLLNMIIGFTYSFIVAFILGIISGNNYHFKEMLVVPMTAMKSVPTASLVYLILMFAGIIKVPIYIVMLVCIPIIYEAVVSGIENIDEVYLDALKIMNVGIINANVKIKIPLAMPYILVGISSSFALSFKIEIMAEVITGSSKLGLGSAIATSQRVDPTNMVPIFAYSLFAIILMVIIDTIISYLKKKIVRL